MKNKRNKKNTPEIKKSDLKIQITRLLEQTSGRGLNYKQISAALGIKKEIRQLKLQECLKELKAENRITELTPGKFKINNRGIFVCGQLERNGAGHITVVSEDGETINISERNAKHALHKDKVKVQVYAKRPEQMPEGEVIEIIERADNTFIGTLDVVKDFAFLLTDSKNLSNDIFIPAEYLHGGKKGEKAIVRIIEWPEKSKNPIGEVVDILGLSGENDTEMHAILAEFGLPYRYPERVERAANRISDAISEEEIAQREDFRGIPTFTIDPKDAKDFDDALSIAPAENGTWQVGVHIADVTHYVRPKGIIDEEAEKRATSVYLVDRTIPMLPERLCNELCSLRPNEDKLCFSCIFILNNEAEILHSYITRTIIRSNRRFSYEEAQEIIETGEGEYREEINTLNALAQKLREKRFKNGAINFDKHEVKFEIDEKGHPTRVYFKYSKEANKLIEEFMLLANRTVAEFIGKTPNGKKAKTFVYRIHDLPDPEKINNLSVFISRFGYQVKTVGKRLDISRSINQLLGEIHGKHEQNLIETITIRSMAKAVYSTTNIGHYGLAFDYYTHFTSPIRRYPDMMVHRLLERYLNNGRSVNKQQWEDLCKHSSEMEQLAANAERASIKYKQVEFMSDHLGQVFEGTISGIAEWGLYVELNENKCEGLVPVRDLDDDYYEFDEKNYCLIGRRKKRIYQLGDPVTVKVAKANLDKKQLDFQLIPEKKEKNTNR